MKYLADLLTAARFVLAALVLVYILHANWWAAIACFALAAVTDALDGICARRWPYTSEEAVKLPWRRLDPQVLDNAADSLLVALASLGLALTLSWWWLVILVIYGVGGILFAQIILFTHLGYPRRAEMADVMLGWWYALNLYAVILQLGALAGILYVAIVAIVITTVLLFLFKRDRVTARPQTYQRALRRMAR